MQGLLIEMILYTLFKRPLEPTKLYSLLVIIINKIELILYLTRVMLKVARYSLDTGPIPPKFERKLRRHKQSFEKIAVVLDKDEKLL